MQALSAEAGWLCLRKLRCHCLQAIGSLKLQMRMLVGAEWLDPAGPYKTAEELWDGEVPEENMRLL